MTQTFSPMAVLLKAFFAETERQLRFLELKHGFTYMSGLAEYRNNYKIVRPYHGQVVPADVVAMTRYERENVTIEIVYKGQDQSCETMLYYEDVLRFSVPELLVAARKTADLPPKIFHGVSAPGQLADMMHVLAKDFQKYAKILFEPGAKLLDRAQTIRVKQMEQAIRQYYADMVDSASTMAAKAFQEKDFRQVISLLEPHKKYLSAGDLKKLHLAKKQILSGVEV